MTFHRRVTNVACSLDPDDIGSFTGNGPFGGEVTFMGRTGTIEGMWTTNCRPDPVTLWSCDGTTIARGSGGLEGAQFHTKWGPGWFPFTYTGTAFFK